MKTQQIDLGDFRSPESRVYSGQDRGKTVRKKLKIKETEHQYQIIKIIIPEDTISLNTSFFLGFLGESVKRYGEINFRKKFIFDCSVIIQKDIDIGIERALKVSSVFS